MNDLLPQRKKIAQIITDSQNIPVLAEKIIDVENTPLMTIEQAVDSCEAYIGVFHKRWGYIPKINNPEKLSISAIEFNRARTIGIPTLILDFQREER